MYIFTCEHKWEAMLTCIYDAWASKKGHANIKLMLEPVEQYSLFDTYTHVDADAKRQKVSCGLSKIRYLCGCTGS